MWRPLVLVLAVSTLGATPALPRERPLAEAIEVATLDPCLERALLLEDVETFLERDTVDAKVHVKVSQTSGTLWFSIAAPGGEQTTRQFVDLPQECEEMRRAVALSIALAIDALAPDASTSSEGRPRFRALGYGVLATPLPDRAALGGGAALRVGLSRWLFPSLGGIFLIASSERLGWAPALRYDARLVAARAEGCLAVPSASMLEVSACAGPWLGAFTTTARGLPRAGTTTTFWSALGAALELHIRLTRAFGIHLGADALVSLRRSKVQVEGSDGQPTLEQEIPTATGMVRMGPVVSF